MKRLILNKRGEGAVGMSFGWIFSLLLILFFIFTAIYGIKYFLNISRCSQVGMFYDSLQKNVDSAYSLSSSDFEMEIKVPTGIKQLCFANLTEEITGSMEAYESLSIYEINKANTFLLPSGKACDMPYNTIEHLNISKITQAKNPLCFDVSDGSTIRIVKGNYDKGVTIK